METRASKTLYHGAHTRFGLHIGQCFTPDVDAAERYADGSGIVQGLELVLAGLKLVEVEGYDWDADDAPGDSEGEFARWGIPSDADVIRYDDADQSGSEHVTYWGIPSDADVIRYDDADQSMTDQEPDTQTSTSITSTTYAVVDEDSRVLWTLFDPRRADDPSLVEALEVKVASTGGDQWVEAPLGCAVGDLLDIEDGVGEVDEQERFEAIDLAREHIDATPYEDEATWAYEDDNTRCIYLVNAAAMAKLGRMLRTPTASTYSIWCSETSSDEVDVSDIARDIAVSRLQLGSFEPSDYEELDLDALRTEAASAGDLRTVAALDLARPRVEEGLSEIAQEQLMERRSRS